MREIVPAATAELRLTGRHAERSATLTTVLPMAWPALVRDDGHIMVASQTQTASGDAARDLGDALARALSAAPGSSIAPRPLPADAPRIQDLVDVRAAPEVIVRSGFDFWTEGSDADAATTAMLERANAVVTPTARLATVVAGYWMRMGERTQLRWVLAEPEDELLPALARLQVRHGLSVGGESRYLGSFRSLGLLVPVWDLAAGVEVDDVEDGAAQFRRRLDEALSDTAPLDGAQRRARESLLARQLTSH